jgi:hypothetical protein
LASLFLHKVTFEPANQYENWQSDGIIFKINKVEVGRFLSPRAKNGKNSARFLNCTFDR